MGEPGAPAPPALRGRHPGRQVSGWSHCVLARVDPGDTSQNAGAGCHTRWLWRSKHSRASRCWRSSVRRLCEGEARRAVCGTDDCTAVGLRGRRSALGAGGGLTAKSDPHF